MNDKYILDGDGNPIPEPDLMKWGKWFEKADRHVARSQVSEALISTVFLGLDHNHARLIFTDEDQRPILFETMIFWEGHNLDQEQDRYATRDEALMGHKAMVARVYTALTINPHLRSKPNGTSLFVRRTSGRF